MKDFKRRSITIVISTMLAVTGLLAGCGGSKEAGASESAQTPKESTEVSGEIMEQKSGEASEETGKEEGQEALEGASEETAETSADKETDDAGEREYPGTPYAEITVKGYGTIKAELDPKEAPITVANFIDLAESGFYDGLTFHRIMDGFMMQGGDPDGNGTGGSGKEIKGEFALNGIENNISHTKGTISMARSQDPDSASSQFFIVQSDSTFLDGQYAGFGHVTEGIELVDQICADARPTDNNGTIPSAVQPVIESIKITYE